MMSNKAVAGQRLQPDAPMTLRSGCMIPDAWFAPYVRASAYEICAPCFFLVRCLLVHLKSVRLVARVRWAVMSICKL